MDEQNLVPTPSQEARQWAMLCHFAAFAGLLIPFGNLLGPLVIWQIKRELDPFVDEQGKEALNFHITVSIAALICLLLAVVLIGFLLLPALGLAALVLTIIGGVKAGEGRSYRYPFTWRLIK